MQLALSTPSTPPLIPAWGELSENSRLGFTSKNPALYLGHNVCKSTPALGFESSLHLNRVRSRCSGEQYDPDLGLYYLRARYYNPATGRFMSRDPLDGNQLDPKSLHKYLYANGDPINRVDPTGRDDDEYSLTIGKITLKVSARALEFGGAVGCSLAIVGLAITLIEHGNGIDVTLGGAGLGLGCGFAALPYFLVPAE